MELFGLVAVARIRGQSLEKNGVFQIFGQFLVEFGSKPFPAHRPQEDIAAARLHVERPRHTALVPIHVAFRNGTYYVSPT